MVPNDDILYSATRIESRKTAANFLTTDVPLFFGPIRYFEEKAPHAREAEGENEDAILEYVIKEMCLQVDNAADLKEKVAEAFKDSPNFKRSADEYRSRVADLITFWDELLSHVPSMSENSDGYVKELCYSELLQSVHRVQLLPLARYSHEPILSALKDYLYGELPDMPDLSTATAEYSCSAHSPLLQLLQRTVFDNCVRSEFK